MFPLVFHLGILQWYQRCKSWQPAGFCCMQGKSGHRLEKCKGTIAGSDQPPSSSEEEPTRMFLDMIRELNDKKIVFESVGS